MVSSGRLRYSRAPHKHGFLGKLESDRWAVPSLLMPVSDEISRHERPCAHRRPILAASLAILGLRSLFHVARAFRWSPCASKSYARSGRESPEGITLLKRGNTVPCFVPYRGWKWLNLVAKPPGQKEALLAREINTVADDCTRLEIAQDHLLINGFQVRVLAGAAIAQNAQRRA